MRRAIAAYQSTSREAWEHFRATSRSVDAKIVDCIQLFGAATCDDIEGATGLEHQTVSAQIRHLVQGGVLVDSGECGKTRRGRSAKRWRLAPPTREGRLF